MREIQTLDDLNKLIGEVESNELEVKSTLLSFQDMLREIHSFINGEEKKCHLIFGVSEDNSNKIKDIRGIEFPVTVRGDEDNHKKDILNNFLDSAPVINGVQSISNQKDVLDKLKKIANETNHIIFNNLKDFEVKIFKYLSSNTEIAVSGISGDKKKIEEHLKRLIVFREIKLPNDKNIVIVEISQSPYRPIYDKKNNKYFIRKTTNGKAASPPMSHYELEKEVKARELRLAPLGMKPVYHYQAISALPELTSLFDLIYSGKEKEVEELLNKCPTLVQMTDSFGRNALHIAVFYEQTAIIDSLINKYDISIYQSDKDGWIPLFQAVHIGNSALTEKFLRMNESLINHRDKLGNNIVLMAALYNQVEVLIYFLNDLKMDKEVKNNEGRTPLLEAAYTGSLQALEFLISTYSNKQDTVNNVVDRDGKNALKIVEQYNTNDSHNELIYYIRNGGRTALMRAASEGDLRKLDELLSKYKDKRSEIKKLDWGGNDTSKIAEISNQNGSHDNLIHYIKNEGRTPLLQAAYDGKLSEFQKALEAYPDRQAAIEFEMDWDLMTTKDIAESCNKNGSHDELIKYIEDELMIEEIFPPLIQAIVKGNLGKLIELLLNETDKLAIINVINWKEKSALEITQHCLKIYKTTHDHSYIKRYVEILNYIEETLPEEQNNIRINIEKLQTSTTNFFKPFSIRDWKTPSTSPVKLNNRKYSETTDRFFVMPFNEAKKAKHFHDYLVKEGFAVQSHEEPTTHDSIICVNLATPTLN